MAELNDLSVSANSNTGRFPNGMQVEQLNDAARELEAMLGREFKDRVGLGQTAGIATAYTYIPYRNITGLAAGHVFMLRFHLANAAVANNGSPTLQIGALAPKSLLRQDGTPLQVGDIVLHQIVLIAYNAAFDAFVCVGIGDSTRSNGMPACTVTSLPALTETRLFLCTNEAGGIVPIFSDGTNWRRVTDRAIAS